MARRYLDRSETQVEDLPVVFFNSDGTCAGVSYLKDPRIEFCEIFNDLNCGIVAKPATPADTILVRRQRNKR